MADRAMFDEERKEWIQADEDSEVLLKFVPKTRLKELVRKSEKMARQASGITAADIFQELLVDEVVLDWRKIDDHNHSGFTVNGKQFPYSKANARELMRRDYEFSRMVNEYSTDAKLFLELEKERQKGNSGGSPAGSTVEASR